MERKPVLRKKKSESTKLILDWIVLAKYPSLSGPRYGLENTHGPSFCLLTEEHYEVVNTLTDFFAIWVIRHGVNFKIIKL